jgi:H+/Cl- antiporter ClcA
VSKATDTTSTADRRADVKAAGRAGLRLLVLSLVVGVVTGAATWLFLTVDHLGMKYLWHERPVFFDGMPEWAASVAVVVAMTAIATVVVVACKGRPFDSGAAEEEFHLEGRMDYKRLLPGAIFSLTSLFSGAAIGPEAPLVDINGGLGSFLADRFSVSEDQLRILTYAGVAGAFSAFFGAAPVGALLAIELISPRSLKIDRFALVSGLSSGAAAWVTFIVLGGGGIGPLFVFEDYTSVALADLGIAVGLGLLGGVVGLVYGRALQLLRAKTATLRANGWLGGLAGGTATAIAAVVSPYLLFSGQTEVPTLLAEAAALGVVVLLALGVGKLALSAWGLSTAYFGGPIFPVMFAGTCFGLALHLMVPAIPAGVAVMGMVAGMVSAAAVAPLSITIFLALLSSPGLTSVIAVAAVAAYIVRQAVAPTSPSIYREAPSTPNAN